MADQLTKFQYRVLEALANACDATITPASGGSAEAKWQLDYVLDVQSPAVDHLTQMRAGCG